MKFNNKVLLENAAEIPRDDVVEIYELFADFSKSLFEEIETRSKKSHSYSREIADLLFEARRLSVTVEAPMPLGETLEGLRNEFQD